MCGIGGCLGEQATPDQMKKMSVLIKHRGPDDYGEFTDKEIALFNNRLSIIDIEGGRQPIFNEDGNVVVVYNGEIYNFPELRQELEKKGHHFKTRTDTEVIAHGYEEYGTSIFPKLNGMFAIALWDRKQKRLLLVRDRVGIKPLYYSKMKDNLVFCSEMKGILAHHEISPSVNKYALYCLISLNYIPFEHTLLKDVLKVPPGHYFDSLNGVTRYWTPPALDEAHSPNMETIRRAVEESVKRQLISDVPVGSFLSGGLDTSTIVAFASKHYQGKLKTFCMGFGHEDDELEDAKLVAEHFGTDHYSMTITDKAALDLYPKMIWHSEQPKLNTYSWFVNEFASKHVKVCLSGLGGDELFFGYPTSSRFTGFKRAQQLMNLPGSSLLAVFASGRRRQILSNIRKRSDTYLSIVSPVYGRNDHQYFSSPKEEVEAYRGNLTGKVNQFFQSEASFVQQAYNAEFFTKLPDDFLSVEDAMSMAQSLENRVPLLDNDLLDTMLPVPYASNYSGGVGKVLLRQAVKDVLPRRCLEKPKQGFSLNIVEWWKTELGEEIRRIIPESKAVKKFFSVEKLKQMIPQAHESYGQVSILWHVYAFHIWHDLFIDKEQHRLGN
ncbi:MAG: asparagine synthase (glutamine-hydrolyzing) [Thaumarchaeota archaeon]|nr:asparagine synthase (glutamine-hydrolyzing) [Nitrososphaerota archaeon]